MSSVLSSLGGIFKSPSFGPAVSAGTLGLGEIGNLLAGRQQQKGADQVEQLLSQSASDAAAARTQLTKDQSLTPEQIAQQAAKTAAPLDQALVQSLNRNVQGDMASRGLAQAPGIFAAEESQAQAPFIQQNYTQALQSIMQKLGMDESQLVQRLGMPAEYAALLRQYLPNQQNLTPAMMFLLQQLQKMKQTNASKTPAGPAFGPPYYPNTPPPSIPSSPGIDMSSIDLSGGGADLSQLGVNPG
jgi:hypothetical protein